MRHVCVCARAFHFNCMGSVLSHGVGGFSTYLEASIHSRLVHSSDGVITIFRLHLLCTCPAYNLVDETCTV